MKMSTMASYQEIMKGLEGSTHVLAAMNEQVDISQISQVLKTFNKESMKSEFKQEAISDAMDMAQGNVDEQADDVYNGILGEIGLEYQIADPTRVKPAVAKKEEQKEGAGAASDDLEARLAALKM
jgi:division protein CdvB (Snf7/Vps24/ESCRT-III family)